MKRLFAFVQEYISTLSILEFGALKVCLMCLGLMLGTCVKSRHRRPVRIAALFGFVATLIPLMLRFFSPCMTGLITPAQSPRQRTPK